MNARIFILVCFSIVSFTSQAGWQDRAMNKIDRAMKRASKCKCLSKTQEVKGAQVKYYFSPKKTQLLRIVEKTTINGATVFKNYFFDKKTGSLIAVNLSTTIYYYQQSDYFAVLSSSNFTAKEAKENADKFSKLANIYIQSIQ